LAINLAFCRFSLLGFLLFRLFRQLGLLWLLHFLRVLSVFWSLRDYRLRLEHWNPLNRQIDGWRRVYRGHGNSLSLNHLRRCDWLRTRNTLHPGRSRRGIFNGRVCQDDPGSEPEGERTYNSSNSGKICGHRKGHGHLQCPEANARIA
jgi:hypothetical protein